MSIDQNFVEFVNNELPSRVYYKSLGDEVDKDLLVVTTGQGLQVEFKTLEEVLNIGLITETNLILDSEGSTILKQQPLGGLLLNMALVKLKDGSYIELTDVTVSDSRRVILNNEDYLIIKDDVESISVSYVGLIS